QRDLPTNGPDDPHDPPHQLDPRPVGLRSPTIPVRPRQPVAPRGDEPEPPGVPDDYLLRVLVQEIAVVGQDVAQYPPLQQRAPLARQHELPADRPDRARRL